MTERFRLITHGKLISPKAQTRVVQQLKTKHQFTPQCIKILFSGKPSTLAQSLNWEQAQKFKQYFKKLGLITHVILQLNEQCLKLGLKYIEKPQVAPVNESIEPETITFNKQQLNPTLFSPKTETEALSNSEGTAYKVVNHYPRWNPLVILIAGLVVSLSIEKYVLRIASQLISTNILTTLIGIAVLIMTIYLFAKMAQGIQLVSIKDISSNAEIIIEEQFSLSALKKRYLIRNTKGEPMGEIIRTHKTAEYIATEGGLTLSYDATISVKDSALDMVDNVSSQFVDNTWLGTLLDIYNVATAAVKRIRKTAPGDIVSWEDGSPIFDHDNRIVATIPNNINHIANINADSLSNDHKEIAIVFSWIILGRSVI